MNEPIALAQVPTSFGQYVRSMGPGLVVALTWLGTGEASAKLLGIVPPGAWSVFWVIVAGVFLFRGAYRHIEIVFYIFLAMLSVSLIGVALWSGPNPIGAAFHSST